MNIIKNPAELHDIPGRGLIINCDITGIEIGDTVEFEGKRYEVTGIEKFRLNDEVSNIGGLIVKDI